jgi:hypothetical protein
MTQIGERSDAASSAVDRLVDRARTAVVDRAAAERCVDELERWARPQAAAPRWVPWLAAGLAAAATIALALWWRAGALERPGPVVLGDRVAIMAAAGTVYRVIRAEAGDTELAVERGAVTARLWPSGAPHRLALSGGGVTATATGTVYSLAITATGPVINVAEGAVEVRAADGLHVVTAGGAWPAAGAAPGGAPGAVIDRDAVTALLALPAPGPQAAPGDAAIEVDATPLAGLGAVAGDTADGSVDGAADDTAGDPVGAAEGDAASSSAAPRPRAGAGSGSAAIKDRWRTARLWRGQGRFAAALAECVAIADARDPVWSPIALVEAIRIALGPLADPERVLALADRMIRDWPDDAQTAEARALRCRALAQLGRSAECAAPAAP